MAPGVISGPTFNKSPLNPAVLNQVREQLFVAISDFTASPNPDGSWRWSGQIKNNGNQIIEMGRLRIEAKQKLTSGITAPAGLPLPSPKPLVSKERISMGQAAWQKSPVAVELRLEVWDSRKNALLASRALPLPTAISAISGPDNIATTSPTAQLFGNSSQEQVTPADPRFDFQIMAGEYLGQGRVRVAVKNNGNVPIGANRLRISVRYNMGAHYTTVPGIISVAISPGETITTGHNGLRTDGECWNLSNIGVTVDDPQTGKDRYKNFQVARLNDAVQISQAGFGQGFFRLSMQNSAPYRVKLKTIIEKVEIWDIAKPASDDSGNYFEQAWDFMTGGVEFDSSGLEPEEHRCTATNILLSPQELADGSSPQVSPSWSIPVAAFQNAIRASCPDVSFSRYSQIYKDLKVKAYTENIADCDSQRVLDIHLLPEGGRDNPTFSW